MATLAVMLKAHAVPATGRHQPVQTDATRRPKVDEEEDKELGTPTGLDVRVELSLNHTEERLFLVISVISRDQKVRTACWSPSEPCCFCAGSSQVPVVDATEPKSQ